MTSTELFPYENHPYRLEFGDKKNLTICWFECEEHLNKYIVRYKLDKKIIKIDYKNAKPIKSSKKNKDNLQQGTTKTSDRSSSRSKGGSKKLDTSGTSSRTRKPKTK
jgi:hypothetical protein